MNIFQSNINKPVFFSAVVLIGLLTGYAAVNGQNAQVVFQQLQETLTANVSWLYVLTVALIFLCATFLAVSKYGDIKLGPDHSEPDFSFTSWFAMLFSAGMGIGLMFFGVSEPIMHFVDPPVSGGGELENAREAMKLTFFHWGFHAWAIYAIVALILAFFGYRHGLPLTIRSALYPIFGKKIYGVLGHVIDVFAIVGTIFGVATSLGLGVMQVNSGLTYLFGIPFDIIIQMWLIIGITLLATLSVAGGLDAGIRRLSEANLFLALALIILVVIMGPTALLFKMFVQNTGSYLSDLINKTFNLYAYQSNNWIGGWTVFYWAFWLSWSPFVGMFIARISKGRTIREFVLGVLFVPALLTFIWMTVFGNTAIDAILHKGATVLVTTVRQDTSLTLFKFLELFPLTSLLSGIVIFMIVLFFVTSADSSAMVLDVLASNGEVDNPLWQRIFWSLLIGLVALVLMFVGGLKTLQSATIASALPFSLILLVSMYGLLKALMVDVAKKESLSQTNLAPPVSSSGENSISWQKRLLNVIQLPRKRDVYQFNSNVVIPAMKSVSAVLNEQKVRCVVKWDKEKNIAQIETFHGDEINFFYQIRPRSYQQPTFMIGDAENADQDDYFRAEVFLREGGQDYDVMGWNQEEVINDIISQYEKHMHFLHILR